MELFARGCIGNALIVGKPENNGPFQEVAAVAEDEVRPVVARIIQVSPVWRIESLPRADLRRRAAIQEVVAGRGLPRVLEGILIDDQFTAYVEEARGIVSLMDYLARLQTSGRGPLPVSQCLWFVNEVITAYVTAEERNARMKLRTSFGDIRLSLDGRPVLTLKAHARAFDTLRVAGLAPAVGSLMYLSPEEVLGLPLERQTWMFQVGTLLCTLLIGRNPFRARSTFKVLQGISNFESPVEFLAERADVPPRVVQFIARCMQKERTDRFSTWADLRRVLRKTDAIDDPTCKRTVAAQLAELFAETCDTRVQLEAACLQSDFQALLNEFTQPRNVTSAARPIEADFSLSLEQEAEGTGDHG